VLGVVAKTVEKYCGRATGQAVRESEEVPSSVSAIRLSMWVEGGVWQSSDVVFEGRRDANSRGEGGAKVD
jgi:hypothetical protein